MAGKIIADQIEHSTAGSLDTSYVVQGSAKHWITFNGTSTVSVTSSFNNTSLSDRGTGAYTYAFVNSMNDGNHSGAGNAKKNDSNDDGNQHVQIGGSTSYTTVSTEQRIACRRNVGTGEAIDSPAIYAHTHGDLA
jgi:hypothetical protein